MILSSQPSLVCRAPTRHTPLERAAQSSFCTACLLAHQLCSAPDTQCPRDRCPSCTPVTYPAQREPGLCVQHHGSCPGAQGVRTVCWQEHAGRGKHGAVPGAWGSAWSTTSTALAWPAPSSKHAQVPVCCVRGDPMTALLATRVLDLDASQLDSERPGASALFGRIHVLAAVARPMRACGRHWTGVSQVQVGMNVVLARLTAPCQCALLTLLVCCSVSVIAMGTEASRVGSVTSQGPLGPRVMFHKGVRLPSTLALSLLPTVMTWLTRSQYRITVTNRQRLARVCCWRHAQA